MKNWILTIFLLLFIPVAYSTEILEFQTGDSISLKIPCVLNNTNCPSTAACNLTITYPNTSTLIDNKAMSYNANYYNYTLNKLENSGDYQTNVYCQSGTVSGYTTFVLRVTGLTTYRCPTDFNLIWFVSALLSLFFLIALIYKWSFLGIITSIGLLFLGFTVYGCSAVFGAVIVSIALLGIGTFSLMKWV